MLSPASHGNRFVDDHYLLVQIEECLIVTSQILGQDAFAFPIQIAGRVTLNRQRLSDLVAGRRVQYDGRVFVVEEERHFT